MHFLRLLIAVLLLSPLPALALEPTEVAVVANKFVTESTELARYYMEKRGIPKENLIRINTTNKEWISREDYNEEVAEPVREFLRNRQERGEIRCLVTIFGVPLIVGAPELSKSDKKAIASWHKELVSKREHLKKLAELQSEEDKQLQQQIAELESRIKALDTGDQGAALDSELALVLVPAYPLQGWVANPYFAGFQQRKLSVSRGEVLMVARLDGPSGKIVRRIIDDSLAAEAAGLQGIAYFDARWPKPTNVTEGFNILYDNSLHLAAERINSARKMLVVVNDKEELFQPGEAPRAALYAGWYSLSLYIDAFDWVPGAVGYHIASGECTTLRSSSSQGWCKRMLEDGVAATVGPVSEPYLTAFPLPEIFFSLLIDGSYSVAEAYFLSLPYLSWQMVLVGDPVYRPFKVNNVRSGE
jgi:uncharacterized protein (TIGR03790 family)